MVKVPFLSGVDELKGEVEELGQLDHDNIVQILGMVYGTPPDGTEPTYMMALEYADTDVEKMVLNAGKTSLLCNDKETSCTLDSGIPLGNTRLAY